MKKVIQIGIMTIIVVILFTAGKALIVPRLLRNANYGILNLEQSGTDTLFIGSSMFRQGIDTDQLSSKDNSTYLLAYNGFQPYAEYTALQYLLNNTEIKTLVIDMYVYSLSSKVGLADTRIIQGMPLSYIISLFSQMKEHGNADCFDLFEMIFQSNNELLVTWPVSFPLINSRYYRGSNIVSSSELRVEKSEIENVNSNLPQEINLDENQIEALKRIINLCNEKNIKIVFVETPKYQNIYDNNVYIDGFQKYIDLLIDKDVEIVISNYTAERCTLSDNVRVYVYNSSDPLNFSDSLHVSAYGREVLSSVIKSILCNIKSE